MTAVETSSVKKFTTMSETKIINNHNSAARQAIAIIQLIGEILLLLIRANLEILRAAYKLFKPTPEKPVKGEIVLVTGAGHGIGKELSLLYASQGATLVCWDINEKTNNDTVKEISNLGYPKAHAYKCNVADRNNVIEVCKKVQKEVGDVSILINNAGIMPCHSLVQHSHEEIKRIFDINIMAHFWILENILPIMIKNNHGHIVALSSCAGLIGLRNLVPYCSSKFAVRGLMESLHQELRADPKCQVKCTTIYPYMVDTGLCKRPVIRFQNKMALLKPKDVATQIMAAQRRNVRERTIPRHFLSTGYFMRQYPDRVTELIQDFMESYVESDL